MDPKEMEWVKAIEGVKALAGKYLTFILGHEECGFEILKVREIMGMVEITSLPQASDYVKGIINLPVSNFFRKWGTIGGVVKNLNQFIQEEMTCSVFRA